MVPFSKDDTHKSRSAVYCRTGMFLDDRSLHGPCTRMTVCTWLKKGLPLRYPTFSRFRVRSYNLPRTNRNLVHEIPRVPKKGHISMKKWPPWQSPFLLLELSWFSHVFPLKSPFLRAKSAKERPQRPQHPQRLPVKSWYFSSVFSNVATMASRSNLSG